MLIVLSFTLMMDFVSIAMDGNIVTASRLD